MKVKKPSSSNEISRAAQMLHVRLAKTPFKLEHEVQLRKVIETGEDENLTRDLAAYHRHPRTSFDLLVQERRACGDPVLAIELDGPEHESVPKVRRRDLMKNRLCRGALPLLRVPYQDIKPQFKMDDFLSYIVGVALTYKIAHEKKRYASPQHLNELTEREFDDISRHDLPKIRRLRQRLARKNRIVDICEVDKMTEAKFALDFNLGASHYGWTDTDDKFEGHLVLYQVDRSKPSREWAIARRISETLTLRTSYSTTEEPRPPWPKHEFDLPAMQAYVKWLESEPMYFPDIPGIRWPYVAWNILEALCLAQLLDEAKTIE